MCKYVFCLKSIGCEHFSGLGTEKHRLCHWKEWKNLRLQSADEVRVSEHIAKVDNRCWLWETGLVSFPEASHTERVINREQASRSQFSWRFTDSEAWNRNPRSCRSRFGVDGPLRRIVNKYAACGWAVVQMGRDGGMTPWHGVGGTVPISSEVPRTIKRAEM